MPHPSLGLTPQTYNHLRRTLRGLYAPQASSTDPNTRTICTVCQDTPNQPIVLRCGHVFCLGCLEQAADQMQRRCPNCRHAYKSVYALLGDHLYRMAAHEQAYDRKPGERSRAQRGVSYSRSRSRSVERPGEASIRTTDPSLRAVRPNMRAGGPMPRVQESIPRAAWRTPRAAGLIPRAAEPMPRAGSAADGRWYAGVRPAGTVPVGNQFTYIPTTENVFGVQNRAVDTGFEAFLRAMAAGNGSQRTERSRRDDDRDRGRERTRDHSRGRRRYSDESRSDRSQSVHRRPNCHHRGSSYAAGDHAPPVDDEEVLSRAELRDFAEAMGGGRGPFGPNAHSGGLLGRYPNLLGTRRGQAQHSYMYGSTYGPAGYNYSPYGGTPTGGYWHY